MENTHLTDFCPHFIRTYILYRYSAYLTPLPIIATATGVTGSMFALEGSLLNAYLLYLANKFSGQRSDENARKVFRCSLWYLPVLLSAFVFHSRNWATAKDQKEEDKEEDWNVIGKMRKQLAKVCMHEVMIQDGKAKAGGLCPAVVVENSVDEAVDVISKVKEQTTVTAATTTVKSSSSSVERSSK